MRQSDVGQTQTQFTQVRRSHTRTKKCSDDVTVTYMNRDLMLVITTKDEIQMKLCQNGTFQCLDCVVKNKVVMTTSIVVNLTDSQVD